MEHNKVTGFTYMSGVLTVTVSIRCPICHARKQLNYNARTQYHNLPLDILCCGPNCTKVYRDKVYKLEKATWLQLKGRQRLPSKVAQRIKHSGVLSRLTTNYIKDHVS